MKPPFSYDFPMVFHSQQLTNHRMDLPPDSPAVLRLGRRHLMTFRKNQFSELVERTAPGLNFFGLSLGLSIGKLWENGGLMGFYGIFMGILWDLPNLVNCYTTMV